MAFVLDTPTYNATLSTTVLAYISTMVGTGPANGYSEMVHGEAGVAHDTSDFDTYFKLTLTSLDGIYSYVMYTTAGAGVDEVILPPSDGSFTDILNPITGGSNIYTCVHIAVPTWDNSVTYTLTANHHVYYNGLVYASLQNANLNKNPVTETAYWAVTADDDINTKYRKSFNLAYVVPSEALYADMNVAVLTEGINMYQKELLASPNFQKASKVWVMLETIDNLVGRSLWTNASDIVAAMKVLTGE